jgi:DNA polymerase III alpha subunit
MPNDFGIEEIARRCIAAISGRCSVDDRAVALEALNDELTLIQESDFNSLVASAFRFAEERRDRGRTVRLIGSGCASLVNYLLGLSDVDPVQSQLPHQRFWATNNRETPSYMFVADLKDDPLDRRLPGLIVHRMAPLEAIPYRLLDSACLIADAATFKEIAAGHTDGVFQLDTEAAREIATRVRPATVRELATVSALTIRQFSDPGAVSDFLRHRKKQHSGEVTSAINSSGPLLFQEELMAVLHHRFGLRWSEAYRFMRKANRNRGLTTDHPMYLTALSGAATSGTGDPDPRRLLNKLARDSRSAVCLAHHLANALTTYWAAFLKTHRPAQFEARLTGP